VLNDLLKLINHCKMYIVTGVSRGLGKAIVEQLLEKGEKVIGIGRKSSFKNENFTFLKCDLNSSKEIEQIEFDSFNVPVTLINNAGIIGEVNRISTKEVSDLAKVLQVNTVAPFEIAHKVYNKVSSKDDFTLVNISSGAANRSIPSWSSYCASKAALNMLSENFFTEEREIGFSPKVYAVSPGVIDTDMQTEIRSVDESNFSSLNNFVSMKNNGDLFSPYKAAEKLLKLIELPYKDEIFVDLRNI